jgi:hypothetical protein
MQLEFELIYSSEHYYAASIEILGVAPPVYMVCELKEMQLNCLPIVEEARFSVDGTLSGTSYNGTVSTAKGKLRFSLNRE